MVLKVAGDFSNFPDIMPELDKYNYTFMNNMMYISDVNSHKTFKKKLQNLFKNNCYISEITHNNLKSEPRNAQDWCEKQIAWASLIEFENKQQKALHETMDLLDNLDKKIDQYIKERGEVNGRDNQEEEGETSKEKTGG